MNAITSPAAVAGTGVHVREHRSVLADAEKRLKDFVAAPVKAYPTDRDRPEMDGTSRLSPYLHFGQLSPLEVVAAVEGTAQAMRLPVVLEGYEPPRDATVRAVYRLGVNDWQGLRRPQLLIDHVEPTETTRML